MFCVLFVCKCVLYYRHRVSIQLQFTNISYHISYHIIYHIISYHVVSYIISYIISHDIISYHISYHMIYDTIWYIMWYITSCCHVMSYYIISYQWYHIIYHTIIHISYVWRYINHILLQNKATEWKNIKCELNFKLSRRTVTGTKRWQPLNEVTTTEYQYIRQQI